MELRHLISGTDIRGEALDSAYGPVTLTDEAVTRLTIAFAQMLAHTLPASKPLRIGVGHDSRLSAARMKAAVLDGLSRCGAYAYDCGLTSTPSMFMSTVTSGYEFDGAIMITASHHPYYRNGLKFMTRDGGLSHAQVQQIATQAETLSVGPSLAGSAVETVDFRSVYAAQLVRLVRDKTGLSKPLAGLRIIVDAGNGAGGFYVDQVLQPLGADTSGSQFLEPDGNFPNHIPNPEDAGAMASICQAVTQHEADLGIIFDTDVDRAGAVDHTGRELNRDRLIALVAAIELEMTPGATIVTDSITSTGLAAFITENGGIHHRYKRGYKNVIDEMIRLNAAGVPCPLAIETSGHAAYADNYNLDDGAYLVTRLLIRMAQGRQHGQPDLTALITQLREPQEDLEIRMKLLTLDFTQAGQAIIQSVSDHAARTPGWQTAPDNHEGIRVSFDDALGAGWFLLRLSVHDPIMPLNIQSDKPGGARCIAQTLYSVIRDHPALDTTPLAKLLEE